MLPFVDRADGGKRGKMTEEDGVSTKRKKEPGGKVDRKHHVLVIQNHLLFYPHSLHWTTMILHYKMEYCYTVNKFGFLITYTF